MSAAQFYETCRQYQGRAVTIRTRDGGVHRGYIQGVDRRSVMFQPMGRGGGLGGYGYGGFGFGGYGGYGGFGYGGGYRIALGAIAGIALLSLFFW